MKHRRLLFLSSAVASLVLVSDVQAADNRINQALSGNGAVASQKDNPFGMPASRGNDGGIVVDATFAHTSNADNEWWEVNLGGPKTIAEVVVWLRSDAIYATRDSNLRLVIYSDAAHSSVVYSADLPDGTSVPLPYRRVSHTLPSAVTGQVVRIEHPVGVSDYLQINEVQVFNQAVEEVNLALTGFASLSSTYGTYGAQRANDGVVAGVSGGGTTGSTAHSGEPASDPIPWWQLDLGLPQSISAIRVFLSADTPQTRNDDIAVVVLDSSMSQVSSNYNAVHPPVVTLPGHDFPDNKEYLLYTFEPPILGQYVQVAHTMTNAQYLVLPEVEIFKRYAAPPTINIFQGPTNRTIDLNSAATMSVVDGVWGANANYLSYQWLSNGVPIPGAHGPSYTTPLLTTLGDYTYGVQVSLPGLTVTTQAVLTVFSDVVPPLIVTNFFAVRSTVKMTFSFSEVLDAATATNAANYVFAGGISVSSLVLSTNGRDVALTLGGTAACDDYSVTVRGVKDLAGNTLVETNVVGTMPSFQVNYAIDGAATSSSTGWGMSPANAIDGDITTIAHTYNSDNEWWEVNLGSVQPIGQIALWFRRDCCETRDGNLVVSVLDSPTTRNTVWMSAIGNPVPLSANPRMTNFVVSPTVSGQIVRVEHPVGIADYLDFTEVQVMPSPSGLCIISQPVNQAVLTNEPASFSVVAQGPGPLFYQWQQNGADLPGQTNSTLQIPKAGPNQVGNYTVVVSNATRVRVSQAATLSLIPPAVTRTLLRIDFDGSLSGTTYALASGEVDVTGTFAALMGNQVVSGGFATLNSANPGEGFTVTNYLVDAGSGVATNFFAEMVLIPTVSFDQGTGQESGYADIFSFGSTWWTDVNHGDGVFALRYVNPGAHELRVDSVGAGGTLTGTNVPLPGVSNHIAMVYRQGVGMTNNALDYYLNSERITTMALANNVGSSGVNSDYATFGQAVPGTTFAPRGLDGKLDCIAYSTFSGVFSPKDNFLLFRYPAPPTGPALYITGPSAGQVTLSWAGTGFRLQENANLANAAGWIDVPGGASSPVTLPIAPGSKYYRLINQ